MVKKNFTLLVVILFCCLIFVNHKSLAQDTGTLRGFVSDSTTSEALAFSSAYIKELKIGSTTDMRGYFLITSIPANQNFTLIITYVGYRQKIMNVRVAKGKVTHYNVGLLPANIQMRTIEQTSERVSNSSDSKISIERISAKQIDLAPKGIEADVFRTIKYLPGVTATSDVSARYYVRGGSSNQNLVLVDGITIYNPFHALGLFSVVDPDVVNNIEFFKGGFGAQFGGRLSSVMNISTKDGNKNKLSAKASASLLSGKLLLEGPLGFGNGSFIISGRKSLSNQIIKKFLNEDNIPVDFYDFSFKANFNPEFLPGSKFTFNGFSSSDNLNNSDPQIENYKWLSNAYGFKWFQSADAPLFFELGLTMSRFSGIVDAKYSSKTALENKISDVCLNMDFTYMFDNRDEINVGFHIQQFTADLDFTNALGSAVNLNNKGAAIIFFGKYKFVQLDFVKLDIGSRINLTTVSRNESKKLLEPRVNISINPFSNFMIKGSYGIYQQELTTISNENEVINIFEPWVIIPDYLPPTTSTQYVIGAEYTPIPSIILGLEGYYKKTQDLPFFNENKINTTENDFISGTAESYGMETSLKTNWEPFTLTTSYTLAYAYKIINSLRYYPKYDIRHNFSVALDANLGAGWQTGIVWTFNSGLPYTQIVGFYDKYYFNNFFYGWLKADPREPYGILGVQNLQRLPTYHRLDYTLSKKFQFDFCNVDLSFSILNVYNRHNIFYFKRNTGERVNMLPFLPSATIRVEL